ncbi:hypothetical protein Tco_0039067 [Tanacetum coccineum]
MLVVAKRTIFDSMGNFGKLPFHGDIYSSTNVTTVIFPVNGIDWNDPSVLRYHALKNKPVSIAQARRNMITYLKNQRGFEVEKDSSKPSERETSKTVEEDKVEEEDVNPEANDDCKERCWIVEEKHYRRDQVTNKVKTAQRDRRKRKKQKDELRMWLVVVPDEEEFVDPEILHTKFPIVN